jgi:hypothetical protein
MNLPPMRAANQESDYSATFVHFPVAKNAQLRIAKPRRDVGTHGPISVKNRTAIHDYK